MPPSVTMLLPGKIKVEPHMKEHEIEKIKKVPAKDYIMDWFRPRVAGKYAPAAKPAESPGDRILLLKAGTSSGKSTTLGPELYTHFFELTRKNIAVTQPRILTAIATAVEIAGIYKNIVMGKNIGYQTGDFTYKPPKGIVFMTTPVLAQQFKTMNDEDLMNKYGFIIIDECHDRTLAMDLTIGLAKKFIYRNYKNTNCPFLILTSATFDTVKYANYYGVNHNESAITLEGINYPIEENFLEISANNYIACAAKIALDIHKNNLSDYDNDNRFTDILIFVYGLYPIKEITTILEKENKKLYDNPFVLIILTGETAKSGKKDIQNVYKPIETIGVNMDGKEYIPKRRIIVSTNVAETGLTLDTLKYIIDTGYENLAMYNPICDAGLMVQKSVTKASATQRKGRVGRRAPGVWYPIYTKETFGKMNEDQFPEIYLSDISETLLGIIVKETFADWGGTISRDLEIVGQFNNESLDLMDNPSVDSMSCALNKLYVLGLIDKYKIPTIIGLITSKFVKINIELVRMILAGFQYGANIQDLITIACFVSGGKSYINKDKKDLFDPAISSPQFAEKSLKHYDIELDDFTIIPFIWSQFMEKVGHMDQRISLEYIEKWCADTGINFAALVGIINMRDDLISAFVQDIGLDPFYNGLNIPNYDIRNIMKNNFELGVEELAKIKRCIYEGFRLRTATWKPAQNTYTMDFCHVTINIQSLYIKSYTIPPKKVLVSSMSMRTKKTDENMYEFTSDTICILDRLPVDETFFLS